MKPTANANPQVEVPVYHLTINFDPADPVTPEQMQAVADRVLADLGLAEHQSLMVAHRDRGHPHIHIMVNRVHPDSGVAWDRWKDRPRIERTLRELERELGLREVAGRLYQMDGKEPPERAPLTSGERRQAERARADQELAAARERLRRLNGAMERVRQASQRFDAALGRVYRDPAAARARFTRTSVEIGTERAVAVLGAEPERFGALKTVEQRRALGLGVAHDDRQARFAAPSAAARARELAEAQHALGALARGEVDRAGTRQEGTGTEAERSAEAARRDAESLVSP